jgi:hypothetical protein
MSDNTGFHLINIPMTVKLFILVWLSTHPHCRQSSQFALTVFQTGCVPIDFTLNAYKTEVMWCMSARRLFQLPSNPLSIARILSSIMFPISATLKSSLILTSRHPLTFNDCVCFAALRQLRYLRRYVTDDCFRSPVVSLVH